MERGAYLYDETSGNLPLTTIVDTNGEFGVNDSVTLPATTVMHAHTNNTINGEPILTTIQGLDTVVFYRVKAP
jgi:hypothetical protein